MVDSSNPDPLLEQISTIQKAIYAQEIGNIVNIRDGYINEFSASDNSIRIIFDHANFKNLHISNNIEALWGYSIDEFYNLNIATFFKLFVAEHQDFPIQWLKWAFAIQSQLGISFNGKQAMCGIKAIRKDGELMRLLIRQSALETNEKGIPTISALTIDNITHLIKADFYWGRMECGIEKKQHHHFLSNDVKNKATDIFNEKEKEVIRLLAYGKESKEIGTLLFMSSHTVDNYRRKMITRTGLRDTTALIQICRMIGGII
jgi:DNA-binding CsgD family transcriptional regulator